MPRKSSELEHTVEDYLVARAEALGGEALKLRPPTGRGFPDRTLVMPGKRMGGWVAFVEVKRPVGGKVAIQQDKWGARLDRAGGRFAIVSTREEVDALFTTYMKERYK